MIYSINWNAPITNPYPLTEKGRKIAQGLPVMHPSDEDWESALQYWERQEIVDKIVTGIANQFPH
jgi:hypothetical protein